MKMATVLEQCITEEQRSVVLFCVQKNLVQRIFIKKCFVFTASGSQLGQEIVLFVASVSLMKKKLKRRCGSG
jgi:hypothetical protein